MAPGASSVGIVAHAAILGRFSRCRGWRRRPVPGSSVGMVAAAIAISILGERSENADHDWCRVLCGQAVSVTALCQTRNVAGAALPMRSLPTCVRAILRVDPPATAPTVPEDGMLAGLARDREQPLLAEYSASLGGSNYLPARESALRAMAHVGRDQDGDAVLCKIGRCAHHAAIRRRAAADFRRRRTLGFSWCSCLRASARTPV